MDNSTVHKDLQEFEDIIKNQNSGLDNPSMWSSTEYLEALKDIDEAIARDAQIASNNGANYPNSTRDQSACPNQPGGNGINSEPFKSFSDKGEKGPKRCSQGFERNPQRSFGGLQSFQGAKEEPSSLSKVKIPFGEGNFNSSSEKTNVNNKYGAGPGHWTEYRDCVLESQNQRANVMILAPPNSPEPGQSTLSLYEDKVKTERMEIDNLASDERDVIGDTELEMGDANTYLSMEKETLVAKIMGLNEKIILNRSNEKDWVETMTDLLNKLDLCRSQRDRLEEELARQNLECLQQRRQYRHEVNELNQIITELREANAELKRQAPNQIPKK